MNMKIPEFGSLTLQHTVPGHFGSGASAVKNSEKSKSFQEYLSEALSSVNSQQVEVNSIQEKLITSPEEVDIHDVTIAMAKARMSLNLAQTVIDRLVTGWNEITTTR